MPRYRIFCKSYYRRTNGTFEHTKKTNITDEDLYEKTLDGGIRIYGCGSGDEGYELETPNELPLHKPVYKKGGALDKLASIYYLPHCNKCNCPENGSPRIEAELVKEENHFFDIDWGFDYYEVLRLPHDCTKGDLKKRYNEYSLKFHPDKFKNKSGDERQAAESCFKDVIKAYEMLIDDKARKRYNDAYEYMPFQCTGCVVAGVSRKNGVRSKSAMRWFHDPDCAKA